MPNNQTSATNSIAVKSHETAIEVGNDSARGTGRGNAHDADSLVAKSQSIKEKANESGSDGA